MIFKYILLDPKGNIAANTLMPCLLNVGTEFEYQQVPIKRGKVKQEGIQATFVVQRINKDPEDKVVRVYCWQTNTQTYVIDHLAKSDRFSMVKSLPV